MKTRYELEYPVQFGSETISALDIQRPKAKVFKKFDLNNWSMTNQLQLIAQLSSVPGSDISMTENLVGELDFSDVKKIGDLIVSWFPKSDSD
jgi:hypothetical protein